MLEHYVTRLADAIRVALYPALFFSLIATYLVAKLRAAKTLKRAVILGLACGAVSGGVLGLLALVL